MRVLILKSAVNFGRFAAAFEIDQGNQTIGIVQRSRRYVEGVYIVCICGITFFKPRSEMYIKSK